LLTVDGKGFSGKEKEHATFTTDFYDFGTEVTVNPPPASEVVDEEDAFSSGGGSSGEGGGSITHLEEVDYGTPGEWKVVADGMRAGKPWRMWVTKTSTGVFCYDAENISDLPPPAVAVPDGQVVHDDRVAMCIGGPIRGLAYGDFVVLAAVTDAGELSLVGRLDGEKAELKFADGSRHPMQVDPATGIAQWRGPIPKGTVKVETGSGTCALGVELDGEMQPTLGTAANEMPCMGDYGALDDAP
jgi:hypothetical protein